MSLSTSDLLWISLFSDHPHPERQHVASARQRASNISDNFGIKPEDIEEYRAQHGGKGWFKAIATFAGVAAVGGILAITALAGTPFAAPALIAGALAGALAGNYTMSQQENRVMRGYGDYLDQVAADARAERGGPAFAHAMEYDNGAGRKQAHASDVLNRRALATAGQGRT